MNFREEGNDDFALSIDGAIKCNEDGINESLRRLVIAVIVLEEVLKCVPLTDKDRFYELGLQIGWQLRIKRVLFKVESSRVLYTFIDAFLANFDHVIV